MEYIVGIAIGIFSVVLVSSFMAKRIPVVNPLRIKSSQSRTYDQLRPAFEIMSYIKPSEALLTQATRYMQETSIRFLTMEGKAYWIQDNKVYVSELEDGDLSSINESTTQVVDMMALDKVELDKMVFIVETLTEGLANDSSGSGN